MSNKVFWSEGAKNDYKNILNYLNQNWTQKELAKFAERVEHNITHLLSNPKIGALSKKKSIRRLVISRQTSIYYKVIQEDIYIISLFDNRQNPERLKSL